MKKKGFTLIELLVVIAIIAMLMAILMPALSKVKKIAARVVCGTNLKGLGTAQTVYANDYDDEYTVQGQGNSSMTWDWYTAGFQNTSLNWKTQATTVTIGASLYLLVREADVSPKSFVCPSSDQEEYDGKNDNNLDIVDLWDFGADNLAIGSGYPHEHVSYSYHMPYNETGGKSRYAADGTRSAAFAVMADKNPYLDPQISEIGLGTADTWMDTVGRMDPYYLDTATTTESSWEVKRANSQPHDRESQNVLFADGHTANEKTTDVGVKNDAIYLPKGGSDDGSGQGPTRMGYYGALSGAPVHSLSIQTGGASETNSSDSFLVNDDTHAGKP